jgi:predicted Mrr-cat superfamily restriction endonuclease
MNVFQMKTKPHDIEHIREFIDENFVCIGWPGIENLQQVNKDEIRDRLKKVYNVTGHRLGNMLGQVNCFVNTMRKGDIVLITERDWANIGVLGDYDYNPEYDNGQDGMCHRRNVEWITRIMIKDLDSSIRRLLSNRNIISQYPDTIEASGLKKYISSQSPVSKINSSKLEDLLLNALEVLEEELKSSNPDRRLKAATELLRLKSNT